MGPSSSKTHFAGIITNLLTSDIAGDDYDFWDDLWKVSLTTEEIFELISVEGNIISHELMNVYIIYNLMQSGCVPGCLDRE